MDKPGIKAHVTAALAMLVASLMTVLSVCPPVWAVGVKPLVIEERLKPGEARDFAITLTPADREETVNISLYEPRQRLTGELEYVPADESRFPAAGWIELDRDRVVVRPGGEVEVKGHLRVPFDAGGSYTAVVMVEPEAEDPGENSVGFRVRYAVRIEIDVERPGVVPKAQVSQVELGENADGFPVVRAMLSNPSQVRYPVTAEASIRDADRRLVERVPLATLSTWRGWDEGEELESRVYPGAEVALVGDVTRPLFPGTYTLHLGLRYGDRGLTEIREIHVTDGRFARLLEGRRIAVGPRVIRDEIRPGGAMIETLTFRNQSDDPLTVRIKRRDVANSYPRSIYDKLRGQFRGSPEFTLKPRASGRLVVLVRAPRDLDPGGYYGYLDIEVLSEEEVIETHEVKLAAHISGDWPVSADVLDVETVQQGENVTLAVAVRNAGAVEMRPAASVTLIDGAGEAVATVDLAPQDGDGMLLPLETGRFLATLGGAKPGEYTALVAVEYQGEQIARRSAPVTVEGE